MARHDRKVRFQFVTAQSETGRKLYRTYDLDPDLMDAQGRATFDVAISLPIVGRLIHYQGWLEPVEYGYSG